MIKENTLSEKDALESLDILKVFTNTTRVFNNYINDLKQFKKEAKEDSVKNIIDDIINEYNQMNSNSEVVFGNMVETIKKMTSDFAKETTGINNLLEAETVIGKLTGLFSSLSTIPQKAFRVFSRILSDAQIKRDDNRYQFRAIF
jgi:hypothetical protein